MLALLTIAVPWVEIVFGSFSLSELAEDGIGGTVSESAAAAMFFYLLAGVAGVGCGIVGIAANKRIAIIIAALGVLGSGVATSLATLIGFAGGALLLAAVSRLPK
ncbi:hypothetical protein [Nocardia sp. AG03]|uniref:hypothetical protein n=1 Tax=Nocardia sp. AG03 TaxID=3025312 RepID=UPI0024189229|nr:hypothetical protein [Nocardia sp. AG03]